MDHLEALIEDWKTTVQTQQHFNDLQLRLRSFFITLYAAVLTAAAYALKEHATVPFGPWSITLATIICGFGLIMIVAFYYTDWGYHQLLKGAVAHGTVAEAALKEKLPSAGLTAAISKSSKESKFLGFIKTKSDARLNWFYGSLFFVMLVAALSASWITMSSSGASDGNKAPTGLSFTANGYEEVHAFRGCKALPKSPTSASSPVPTVTPVIAAPLNHPSPTPAISLEPKPTPKASPR
jgi:hypothetical protein